MKRGYKKLRVIDEAKILVIMVYSVTRVFPKDELYGIVSQLRRAAVSVPTNIVEGYTRTSSKEFIQFLNIANASLVEVEFLLELSYELDYLSKEKYEKIDSQRRKVAVYLAKFISAIKQNH